MKLIAEGEPLPAIDITSEPELAQAAGLLATPGFTLIENGVVIKNIPSKKTREEILGGA
jgi:hypothetical protein